MGFDTASLIREHRRNSAGAVSSCGRFYARPLTGAAIEDGVWRLLYEFVLERDGWWEILNSPVAFSLQDAVDEAAALAQQEKTTVDILCRLALNEKDEPIRPADQTGTYNECTLAEWTIDALPRPQRSRPSPLAGA